MNGLAVGFGKGVPRECPTHPCNYPENHCIPGCCCPKDCEVYA